ncbi:hypothetical protein SAMN04490357_6006 [Streptomyces misionensis]|uniref:Uncharacterized protein n=2 Tax=Streptomyces misionensis TaxID=67331 RepID=A0A1H5DXR0_9ACTN|nr:hypothetical protein SAMN04490357_6006 [Streptomyces misionensis]
MLNTTVQPPVDARGRMTMRVYTVDRDGTITQDRGTVTVAISEKKPPLPTSDSYPPCRCPLHRAEQAVSR